MNSSHLKTELRKYAVVFLISTLLFIGFSVYISLRRGYYDLYIINKVLAGVAAIDFCVIVLLGPLTRLFAFVDRYLELRKEFGIIGGLLAISHVLISFFFLPQKFPLERFFTRGLWPFIFGLIATIVLIFLFFISNEKAKKIIGGPIWWKMQYWGMRIIFVFTLLHVFVMKWNSWVTWYIKGGEKEFIHPEWPGAGVLVGWFIAFVLLIRIAELWGPRAGKIMWYITVVALPFVYVLTFWRGSGFL